MSFPPQSIADSQYSLIIRTLSTDHEEVHQKRSRRVGRGFLLTSCLSKLEDHLSGTKKEFGSEMRGLVQDGNEFKRNSWTPYMMALVAMPTQIGPPQGMMEVDPTIAVVKKMAKNIKTIKRPISKWKPTAHKKMQERVVLMEDIVGAVAEVFDQMISTPTLFALTSETAVAVRDALMGGVQMVSRDVSLPSRDELETFVKWAKVRSVYHDRILSILQDIKSRSTSTSSESNKVYRNKGKSSLPSDSQWKSVKRFKSALSRIEKEIRNLRPEELQEVLPIVTKVLRRAKAVSKSIQEANEDTDAHLVYYGILEEVSTNWLKVATGVVKPRTTSQGIQASIDTALPYVKKALRFKLMERVGRTEPEIDGLRQPLKTAFMDSPMLFNNRMSALIHACDMYLKKTRRGEIQHEAAKEYFLAYWLTMPRQKLLEAFVNPESGFHTQQLMWHDNKGQVVPLPEDIRLSVNEGLETFIRQRPPRSVAGGQRPSRFMKSYGRKAASFDVENTEPFSEGDDTVTVAPEMTSSLNQAEEERSTPQSSSIPQSRSTPPRPAKHNKGQAPEPPRKVTFKFPPMDVHV
eukprot:Blabericola_migrator_1__495@NODE_111_length_13907_cov_66_898049_g99_i0_p2_GENE_NODE_111_length_13907_cov_66_898049_g99_i0NODE_111_length_13907_cov_66_898049_g99_i0_p2_ORF_typecomplete_len575_score96_63DUF5603/PF18231_1/0_15H2O2_YaaD/PF03883_14/0_2DUF1319/PF07028_11/9_6e02DUF1319/PF07028_11/0_99Trimer_CC/PF08954_11/0_86Trimer_CC/PF08954_11/1_5e03_NODE_111_length_13907_cov_66_898049_g99_i0301754